MKQEEDDLKDEAKIQPSLEDCKKLELDGLVVVKRDSNVVISRVKQGKVGLWCTVS